MDSESWTFGYDKTRKSLLTLQHRSLIVNELLSPITAIALTTQICLPVRVRAAPAETGESEETTQHTLLLKLIGVGCAQAHLVPTDLLLGLGRNQLSSETPHALGGQPTTSKTGPEEVARI